MHKPEDVRVFIAIPSGSEWSARFAMSLVSVAVDLTSRGVGLRIKNKKGSLLPQLREQLIESALDYKDMTHVLFLDSDMVFPADLGWKLLRHSKEVVACNCSTKGLHQNPTARDKGNKFVYTEQDSVGLRRVWRVGTGAMAIDLKVFEKIKKPWFPVRWDEEVSNYVGEDWNFCQRLQDADIPIYIDQAASKTMGHEGVFVYGHDGVILSREMAKNDKLSI